MSKIQYVRQYDSMECGITCLSMICKIFNKNTTLPNFIKFAKLQRKGFHKKTTELSIT